ncbi:FkbM family methyltransferase [Saccharopolyspora spinosa]|uniref:FkbM family methyltransferase n=1 Tax=Saccharopolyspora spinosa TaxID=60894 RepID=UPI0002379BD0|nr:FkbM family methyltransferase [Saccharopolyspora spinosa]
MTPGAIDLLKMDIEGAEADALAGIGDHDWARTRQVVLEVHDFAGAPAAVRTTLAERGFTITADRPEGMLGGLGTKTVYARR